MAEEKRRSLYLFIKHTHHSPSAKEKGETEKHMQVDLLFNSGTSENTIYSENPSLVLVMDQALWRYKIAIRIWSRKNDLWISASTSADADPHRSKMDIEGFVGL